MGIEVYFFLLILAVPLWLFWRWVFRKNDRTPRNIASVLATLLSAPVVYICIALFIFWCMSYYPKKDFDRKIWMTDKDHRYEMSGDIIKSKMLAGKTKKEVITILGVEGNEMDSDQWGYELGYLPEIGNIDPDILDITFKNGKVTDVGQHNS